MLTDLKPQEFYSMTYRQLVIYLDSYYTKKQEQSDFEISLAWQNANWQRCKKMPNLKSVLSKKKPKKEQTGEEMFNVIKDFAVAMGAEIR